MNKLDRALEASLDPLRRYREKRCAAAVPTALDAYRTGLPASYPLAVHEAHMKTAEEVLGVGLFLSVLEDKRTGV